MSMIGLLDANNFFVSCERLFRPDLHNKPVAVLSSNDGCIVARSNEVKAMGVPMGIPLFQAKQLVDMSQVTLFSSNFTLYRDVSRRVMEVLRAEVGECEQYSVDESFFLVPDTTTDKELQALRKHVIQATGIPVTVGVATTKTLAKTASELGKKSDGVEILTKERWQEVSKTFPVGEIWNSGRATTQALKEVGVLTASDLMQTDRQWIGKRFGVGGCRLYDELHGQVVHEVEPNSNDIRQSLTSSRSFAKTTNSLSELESAVAYHINEVAAKLRAQNLLTTRLYVLARAGRHSDFAYRKGSVEVVLTEPSNSTHYLLRQGLQALRALYDEEVPYKKAGVVAAGLVPSSFVQASLFTPETITTNNAALDEITDSLNRRFGAGTVKPAVIKSSGSRTSALLRSQHYTTVWKDIPTVTAT